MSEPVLAIVLRRDRAIVIGGLAAAVLLSWAYLLWGAGMDMSGGSDMAMPRMDGATIPGMDGATMPAPGPSAGYIAMLFVMWAVMMAAMMLPSAAPMILFYASIVRRRRERGEIAAAVGSFAAGYLVVWAAFSVAPTAMQAWLGASGRLSPAMTTSGPAAALLLIAAGLYQFTPLKQACLGRCRSPLGFVLSEWREGARGAMVMGLRHGMFCVGCCWALMLLLFVGGVMNLVWIGLLAVFVLVEKVVPAGSRHARIAGAALVAWGAAILLSLA